MVTDIFGTPISRLHRMMSDGWMMRCGRFSRTSPTDELLPLLYFPPLNPPPPRLTLPLPEFQLPLPPLDGLCATWAPLLRRLVSPLQLDQPDPNPIPQATLLVCRYTQSRITRGFQAYLFLGNIDVCLHFSLVPGPDQQSKNTVSKTSSSASGRVRTKSWKFLKCVILPWWGISVSLVLYLVITGVWRERLQVWKLLVRVTPKSLNFSPGKRSTVETQRKL